MPENLKEGAVAGGVAYVVGYVLTFVWKAGDYEETFEAVRPIANFLGAETPPVWKIVGWIFYSAHFVESRVDWAFGTYHTNLVQSGDGNLQLLYLVPPLLLATAGYFVAKRGELDEMMDAVRSGAKVTVGYLPLVFVGALLFRVGDSGPGLVPSVLVAGIIIPLIFGSIGGVIARGTVK
ncbi:MAG: transporter [Halobacteria archaeon]|nr:transporter [Halobacteria archaeon]